MEKVYIGSKTATTDEQNDEQLLRDRADRRSAERREAPEPIRAHNGKVRDSLHAWLACIYERAWARLRVLTVWLDTSLATCFRLDAYDAQRNLARVSFQSAALTVDTRVLSMDGLELRIGSMYQFLGETQRACDARTPEVLLVARVARNVDSLDMDLFLQALELRRQFLATH